MRAGEALGHLRREDQRLRDGKRAGAQDLAQAPALHEFHGDEQQPVTLFHGVDVHDVGVIEGRRGPGFALKPCAAIERIDDLRTWKLERHPPLQPGVLGDEHLSHAAAAEPFQDQVVNESSPNHGQRAVR